MSDLNSAAEKVELAESVPTIEDAIITLQLLQIRDRELLAKISKLGQDIEQKRSELSSLLAEVDQLNSGLMGFVRKATLGICLPPHHAYLLDSLNLLLAEMEEYFVQISKHLAAGRELALQSERAADEHNKITLRRRAIAELETTYDTRQLDLAQQQYQTARQALEENDLSLLPEEALGDPEDRLDQSHAQELSVNGKLSAAQHVDHVLLRIEKNIGNRTLPEFLSEKRQELGEKIRQRLQQAGDQIKQKIPTKKAQLSSESPLPDPLPE